MIAERAGSRSAWLVGAAAAFAVAAVLVVGGWVAVTAGVPDRAARAVPVVLDLPASAAVDRGSRASRLREFRRMLVALYRVPAARSSASGDPLADLWRQLAARYGADSTAHAQAVARRAPAFWSLGE